MKGFGCWSGLVHHVLTGDVHKSINYHPESAQTCRLCGLWVVVVATPVYKAAYTGLLKAFLDVLPRQTLLDKTVFPIAPGGSLAHLLTIDFAFKPVLSALGAQHVLNGLYCPEKIESRSR